MFSIKDILPDVKPIKIVDVGAMALEDSPSDYHPLIEKGLAEVIGFEPVAAEDPIKVMNPLTGETDLI